MHEYKTLDNKQASRSSDARDFCIYYISRNKHKQT